jgi:alkyl hydroperoxide reductase subunit F
MAVPTGVYLNGEVFGSGPHDARGDRRQGSTPAPSAREAPKARRQGAFDVLIVGGGPAGAAAAIYAARKGIRTGVAAERFGGQVLDTMAIENFISVQDTEGPKLAPRWSSTCKDYDVDIMNLQRAERLIPATEPVAWSRCSSPTAPRSRRAA